MAERIVTVWMIACLVLLRLVVLASGFQTGAHWTTCWTRHPKHEDRSSQTSVCPFLITLDPPTYTPGQDITVTIADPDGGTFKGFQIAAFRHSGTPASYDYPDEVVGQFTQLSEDVRAFPCFPGFQNMATHSPARERTNVTLTWKAPSVNVGNLTFKATIVMDYEHFWTRESKELSVDDTVSSSVVETIYQVPVLNEVVKSVEFSGCGSSKSCLFYPRYCDGDNYCIAAVSFQYRSESDDYLVEMLSNAAKNYVSVGFSDDKLMGGEETYTCVSQDGVMSIQHGWNPDYFNERLIITAGLSDLEIRHADGRLECRFVIQPVSNVYRINQSAPSLEYWNRTYDRNQTWYVQMAWGMSMPRSNVMARHRDMPFISDDKINLKDPGIHRGSAHHRLIRAHVAVMAVAWVFLNGIVTVVARYYRNWLGEKRLCGTKVWLQVHRGLAILTAVLTGTGLLLIFARFDWETEIREQATPHAYVGLALAGAVALQLIGGILRPGPDSCFRPVFNWGHRFLGHASHITAAVTMFLGFDIDYITSDMRKFGFIALGVWVAVQLLCHLVFGVLACRRKGASLDVSGKGDTGSVMGSTLLAVYIIVLAGLCVAVILAFVLF